MQLEKSDGPKFVMQVYKQATTFQGKPHEHEWFEQFVQKYLKRKTRDSLLEARNKLDEKPASGAPATGAPKENGKENGKGKGAQIL